MHSIASLLRKRRLQWLQKMLKDELYHQQYFASLFGKFPWELHDEIEDGKPTDKALDVIKQMYDDLRALFPDFAFTPDWKDRFRQYDGSFDEVLTFTCPDSRMPMPPRAQAPPEPNPDGFVEDVIGWRGFVCPDCGIPFPTQQGLNGHRTKTHKYVAWEAQYLEGNTCIWCRRTLANRTSAIRHIKHNFNLPVCAGSNKGKTSGPGFA